MVKPAKAATTAKIKAPKPKDLASELGVDPSELGALNAAHASLNALAHASPNSRVGRIAAYRDAVLEGQELQSELDEKSALLETLAPPDRTLADIEAALTGAEADVQTNATSVAALEDALAAAGGSDPTIESDLVAARDALTAATDAAAALMDEQTAAAEYATLSGEVDTLTQQVEAQPELERTLLEAAANKPVTDEVEAAVKILLGL